MKMKRYLSHCLAIVLVSLLAVGAPADVVQTTNPRTAGGSGGGGAFTGGVVTDLTTFGTAADAADSVALNETVGCITFEGSSADTIETRLCVLNPTGVDSTFNLPTISTTSTLAALNTSQTFFGINTFQDGIVGISAVEAVTVTKTTTPNESRETYTNTGDADGATITLQNDPRAGAAWRFAVTVAQTLTIVPNTGETLYLGTDQCLASISSATVGATLEIRAVVGGSGGVFMSFGEVTGWTCNDA